MTSSPHHTTGRIALRTLAGWLSILALALALTPAVTRAGTSLQVGIAPPDAANESNRTAFLTWTAAAGGIYKVQSSTNLGDPTAWTTEDAVSQSTVGPLKWMAPEALRVQKYYRLILPQPQIFSVEPAVIAPGVPVGLYVVGQSLSQNDVLQINGVPQSNAVFLSSTLGSIPSFTPDVAGTYQVTLLVNGLVVSSFNVTAADPLVNPELVLQGPPTKSPVSPVMQPRAQFLEGDPDKPIITGSQYNGLSARSDGGGATVGRANFDAFTSIAGSSGGGGGGMNGLSARSDGGGATVGRANFDVFTSIAGGGGSGGLREGKKGLNAVNVKLASRTVGGGGDDCDDGDPTFMAALMKAKEKANQTKCGHMLRLQPFSGEVRSCDGDMAIPGRGLDFVWARTYRSRSGHLITLNDRWTFSYAVHCAQNGAGGMDVFDGTGRKDTFKLQTNGVYTCPEFFREGTLSNNAFRLTFADTGHWDFNPLDGSPAAGTLAHIVDRNGNTMSLNYDGAGHLVQVVDDLGRTNTVSYNPAGQLASVTDFSGRAITYAWYSGEPGGSPGDLKSVTSPPVTGTPDGNDFPDGKTVTYTYSTGYANDAENHLLLSVTDPKGQPACQFTYEHTAASPNYLHCVTAQEGTNQPMVFTYLPQTPAPSNHFAVVRCVMNDPVGNVTEGFFDARNRCVIEADYTGRATPGLPVTDTLNRPAGQLRETDPVAWMRTCSWNNDSLCTLAVAPGGQQIQCVYQSDFDPATPARKRADCRVVRELATGAVDLDGDGVPDVTDRSWHYTYDPRFGSDPTARDYCVQYRETTMDAFGDSGEMTGGYKGWDGTIKGNAKYGRIKVQFHWDRSGKGDEGRTVGVNLNPRSLPRQQYFFSQSSSFTPTDNGMAIKTKGTGADKNRVAAGGGPRPKGWDGTIKGLIVPDGNGIAIKTKGTGADANRTGQHQHNSGLFAPEDKLVPVKTISWAHDDEAPKETVTFEYGSLTIAYDPRGNVTTGTYDSNGNRIKVQFHWDRQSSADRDFAYDSNGQCVGITNAPDANGRRSVDTFTWSQGQATQCVLDAGAGGLAITSSFEYDPRGNLTRFVDPRSNDCLFTYNALDQCVRAQSPVNLSSRNATDYFYDANDNLIQCTTQLRDATDALQGGRTDIFQYDPLDRLAQIALAVDATHSLTNRFVYDGNHECVQVLGGDAVSGADPHQTVAYQYDERGLLLREITAPGSPLAGTSEFSYTANCNPATNKYVDDTGAASRLETFTYDGFDRLASDIDPMGNQTVCFYDANDNLRVVRRFGETNDVPGSAGNVRLAESSFDYDGLDRCIVSHDLFFNVATQSPLPGGECRTAFAYAPDDECVSVTDTLGHVTTCGYDTACRPVSVTDALGNQRSVVYDADANPLTVVSTELPAAGGKSQVFSVTNIYDSLNRCVRSADSAGNTGSCSYDSLDRCVRTTDPRGALAFYSYDLLDRCTVAIGDLDGDGLPDFTRDITTTFTWSSSTGELLAVTDSNTNTTSNAYDSLGRCITVTHADGTQEQLTWSPASNLIGEQDANGTTITNTYDLCRGLVHRDIAARNTLTTTTFETFAHDGCGRLTGHTNDTVGGAFAYDSLGDCASETLNGLATTSTYDALGNRLSLSYPGGRTLGCTYDTLNRCASITDSGLQLAGCAYDGPDRLSLINYGNGTRTQIAYDGRVGSPNAQNDFGFAQVSRVRHGVVASGAVIDDRTFGYDPAQNKAVRNFTSPFTLGGATQAMSFQYDPACRLVGSLVTTNGALVRFTSYGLDRMGNRTNVTGAACSGDYTMNPAIPPADFQMNQYTATPCDTRTYDDDGNLVGIISPVGPVVYQYDYAGRLAQVLTTGTGALAPVASYTYDALGRRATKTVYAGGLPPATTQFLYAGGDVIEERRGGLTTATYARVHCFGAGQPSAQSCLTMRTGGQDYYFHADDQGNALALSDSTGTVVERYDYDDYGAVTFLTSDGFPTGATSSSVGNVYCWGGLRLDPETGLHNNDGGGYFEPQTGRAVRGKVKVIKDMGGSGFVGNNPWSGGSPSAMQKGTVKFFNETKGFGMVVGGGDGGVIGLGIDINALIR